MKIINKEAGKYIWEDTINPAEISDEDLVITYQTAEQGLEDHFEDSPEWCSYKEKLEMVAPEYKKRNIQRKFINDVLTYYID